MGCAKDGNLKDFKSINRTAKEYQARQEKQADETIQACLQGKLTERQAKEALAKQFGHFRDRRGFQKAIEKLAPIITPTTARRITSESRTMSTAKVTT